ncbi:DUF1801 domain-containing protein [Aridibaculum aurantiacum]|uniref:DUF1801 domain-containing protein n=1 Tax=Aridibaculum aurantiacum TaxID=2810307 RepID=UPI001A964130|nr:DUF1801 domain-containing protein [Aridibaculum aurantiacum]
MEPEIENFLQSLPEEKRKVALKLREVILKAHAGIGETIKWGQLTFVAGKSNIAFIYTYKTVDYVNLGFLKATSLLDPNNLFEGTGTGMRHIKVKTVKDIPTAQVKAWVKEAVAIAGAKKAAVKAKQAAPPAEG